MKVLITILLAIMLIALNSCSRTSTPTAPTNTANPSTSPTEQLNHPAGGTTPVADVKYFRGSIGSALGLQMKLTREGDKLWGSYFYQKVGTKIDLKGTIDGNGYLTLEEFDPQGKQTGVFKGIWQTKADDGLVAIAGNWTKPNGDKKTAFSLHQEPVEFSGSAEITSKTIKENNKKLKYEIDVEYPQVTGASDNRFDKFNKEAKNLAGREVANFTKDMDEWAAEQADLEDQASTLGSSLNISYNIGLATDDLISTKFDIGTYFKGAAHPNTNSRVLNYDLKTGKLLKLSDLFKPGIKYLQTISSYSIKDLKKQSQSKGGESILNDEGIQTGAGPDPDNYKSWTITKKGLGITFDSYQVAPYAAGPQYVLVPYSALKDIIKPDGPLAQFVK